MSLAGFDRILSGRPEERRRQIEEAMVYAGRLRGLGKIYVAICVALALGLLAVCLLSILAGRVHAT